MAISFVCLCKIAKRGEDEAKMNEATNGGEGRVGVGGVGGMHNKNQRANVVLCKNAK